MLAPRGAEALRLARELRPSAITLDVLMPGMDGWAVLRALKADPELRDIPVVLVTISTTASLGFALGAADFLTKPIDRDRAVARRAAAYRGAPGEAVRAGRRRRPGDARDARAGCWRKQGWQVREAENGRAGAGRGSSEPGPT